MLYWDKFYQYIGPATIISIIIDLNTTKNTTLLYYNPGVAINYFLIFFCLIFKVNIDNFSKKQVFDVVISISLKYISSRAVIVFIIWYDFQYR